LNWNADKPDGTMRKVLDVTRMKAALGGWSPPTSLRKGLEQTVSWYRTNKVEADTKW
jgi:GDP-L-fucose synthase